MTASTPESKQIESARKLAIDAARMAAQTHCEKIVVLDVRGLSPITDFFVIASGTSDRQMKSVADEITEMAKQSGNRALSATGLESGSWVLVDFVDVIVHLFSGEARMYYDLENLWGDAQKVMWDNGDLK